MANLKREVPSVMATAETVALAHPRLLTQGTRAHDDGKHLDVPRRLSARSTHASAELIGLVRSVLACGGRQPRHSGDHGQ